MKTDIVEIYKECGDFKKAVVLSGLPPLIAHMKLMSSGVVSIKDRVNYASKNGKLGAKAEQLFQKLVPSAIDANRVIRVNNPHFDFMLGDLTVDVKYSSIHKPSKDCRSRKSKHWRINLKGDQDITVGFLESEPGKELDDPICVVLPKSLVANENNIYISLTMMRKFFDYKVELDELNDVMLMYSKFYNGEYDV